jgi:UTP-glucose-1-phosphate uridylyltransferase
MKKPALMILAAGLGSRYGGLKQIDAVGPWGETIMGHSIYDALRAGFARLVFVIRREIEEPFRRFIGARYEKKIAVESVFQELEQLPARYSVPSKRQKPRGAGHAILMGNEVITGPFAVINADCFYGSNSFHALVAHRSSGTRHYAMMGFILSNMLSEFGGVARGPCQVDAAGFLENITEINGIGKESTSAKYADAAGRIHRLRGQETISMNLWGFTPTIFGYLQTAFLGFLERQTTGENGGFYIPSVVNDLASAGIEKTRVLQSPDAWFGVACREDRLKVVASLAQLVARGHYPEVLWK